VPGPAQRRYDLEIEKDRLGAALEDICPLSGTAQERSSSQG